MKNMRNLTLTGLFLALCVVGSMIKIFGSVALDSLPAFIGTIILGPVTGVFLGSFGHLATAIVSGFPLTFPVHLLTSVLMGFCMLSYGIIRKNATKKYFFNQWGSLVIAYLINTPLSLLALYPFLGKMVLVLFLPVTIGSLVNLFMAETVLSLLEKSIYKSVE